MPRTWWWIILILTVWSVLTSWTEITRIHIWMTCMSIKCSIGALVENIVATRDGGMIIIMTQYCCCCWSYIECPIIFQLRWSWTARPRRRRRPGPAVRESDFEDENPSFGFFLHPFGKYPSHSKRLIKDLITF